MGNVIATDFSGLNECACKNNSQGNKRRKLRSSLRCMEKSTERKERDLISKGKPCLRRSANVLEDWAMQAKHRSGLLRNNTKHYESNESNFSASSPTSVRNSHRVRIDGKGSWPQRGA